MLLIQVKDRERVLVVVGDIEIWVSVTDLGPGKTKIGIDAPKTVQVLREGLIKNEDDVVVLKAVSRNEIRKAKR